MAKKIFNKSNKNTAENSEDQLLRAIIKGEPINREQAMSIPAVAKAVNRIANSFALLPFELYRETEDKNGNRKVEKIYNDRRVELVNDDTGDTLDGLQFKKALCIDYLLGKGGYAFVNSRRNQVVSLHYVPCDYITFNKNSDIIHKSYNICVQGKIYKDYQFLKILRESDNGIYGRSLVSEIEKALQAAYSSICYLLKLTKTSGLKKGFIESIRKLDDDSKRKLKNSWYRMFEEGTESIVVLNEGVKFTPAGQTPYEMQLQSIRSTLNKELSEIFFDYEDPKKFYKFAIFPIVTAFESALNRYLLLEDEKSSLYWVADDRKLNSAALEEKIEAYNKAVNGGFMMPEEARYQLDMPYCKNLDFFVMNLGNVLMNPSTGEYYTPNTGEVYKISGKEVKKNE